MSEFHACEPAIETVGLTKQYKNRAAVDDLTLRIAPGTTFGFIGPNGAGKTTTIRMLMGMLRPTAGRVQVFGRDVAHDPTAIKQRVGYVPELHLMHRWMRVHEVIRFCRHLFDRWDEQREQELRDLFGVPLDRRIKQLSKGMLAKLSLILALSHDPEVLILDEPTSGLDPLVREEFLEGVLRGLCQRERTVLFSSHTLDDVQRLADTVGIICDGRLIACGPIDTLIAQTKRIRVVLEDGAAPIDPPDGTVWQRRDRREWLLTVHGFSPATLDHLYGSCPVKNVEVGDLGLEDIFKDLVKGRRDSA